MSAPGLYVRAIEMEVSMYATDTERVLAQIEMAGVAQAVQLDRLESDGVPITDLVRVHLGVSREEVRALVGRGELDADTVVRLARKDRP